MHARTRKISEWHVGLEAQFFVRANERELRLGSHCPVGRWGHLSRTPSGESALRWPHRPVPLQPKSRNFPNFSHNSTACTARHQLFAKLEGESSQNLPKLGTFCPKTTTQLRLLLALSRYGANALVEDKVCVAAGNQRLRVSPGYRYLNISARVTFDAKCVISGRQK